MASAAEQLGRDAQRYSSVAIAFHWLIAALIVLNLVLGLFHDDFGREARSSMMFVHKATGITILALSLLRLLWRLGHRPPPPDPVLKRWEAMLAGLVHRLFYLLLIAIPLSGWMLSSSSNRPTDYNGLFEIAPLPVPQTDDIHDALEDTHELLGKLMIALIILHVAGALKHHAQGHRHLTARMAPWLGGAKRS
jgi:cytochrome b561